MAVHCGVCGQGLYDAPENWGGFSVSADFRGWDESRIKDTCRACSTALCKAVADAADVILAANLPRVEALRAEVAATQERQAQYERARAAVDRDWASRNPTAGTS